MSARIVVPSFLLLLLTTNGCLDRKAKPLDSSLPEDVATPDVTIGPGSDGRLQGAEASGLDSSGELPSATGTPEAGPQDLVQPSVDSPGSPDVVRDDATLLPDAPPDAPAVETRPADLPLETGVADLAVDLPPDAPTTGTDAPGTCPPGQKICAGGTGSCIDAACCTAADCPGLCQTCNASHACVAAVSQVDPNGRCLGTCDSTGACKSKQGQSCTAVAGGCVSGTTCSADGICCESACTSPCMACDISGSLGLCKAVTSGSPHAGHTSCGTDATCAGTCAGKADGSCSYPISDCGAGSTCSGGSLIGQSTCSNGICVAPAPQTCPSTGCNSTTHKCNDPCPTGTTACGTSCCAFVNGPCAVTQDYTTVEVFGRGDDSNIYHKVLSGGSWGTWQRISGMNGSLLHAQSDLDCTASTNTIHVVGLGASPSGTFLHATGSGATYSQFANEISGSTFSLGVSIGVVRTDTSGRYIRSEITSGVPTLEDVSSGTPGSLSVPLVSNFTSAPDVLYMVYLSVSADYLVGYDTSGQLAIYHYAVSAGGSGWWTPLLLAAPPGKSYAYSPTICAESNTSTNVFTRHVVAVAGGKLWYSKEVGWGEGYSAWEQMGITDVVSSPDCTVTSDSTVHVAALMGSGTIVDVHGTGGSWTATDLGVY